MSQVAAVLRQHAKPGECIVLMGDINGRLGRSSQDGRIGQFTPHQREDEGGKLLRQIMEEFDLWASQTHYKNVLGNPICSQTFSHIRYQKIMCSQGFYDLL